jgi:hypothetical protein
MVREVVGRQADKPIFEIRAISEGWHQQNVLDTALGEVRCPAGHLTELGSANRCEIAFIISQICSHVEKEIEVPG